MRKTNLIDTAKKLIKGARPKEYGEFADNIDRLQLLMFSLTGKDYSRHELRSFFIALKLCRHDQNGFTDDTLTDLIGYIQLIGNDQDEHK